MLQIIKILFITMLMMVGFGMTVSASEESMSEVDVFMSVFNLEEEDLSFGSYTDYGFVYEEYARMMMDEEDTNVFGNFKFSGGLGRQKFSTFASDKSLVGYGEEDMVVGLLVYTEDEDGFEAIESSYRVLGASGLFSHELCFAKDQKQYLLVAVKDGDLVVHRVYEVTTKEEATKSFLENLEIEFFQDEEEEIIPEFEIPQMGDLEI